MEVEALLNSVLHTKTLKEHDVSAVLPDIFTQGDRIYLPVNITPKQVNKLANAKKIYTYVSQKVQIDEFDYLKGKVRSKKQTLKIGKLVSDNPRLAKKFQSDPIRNSSDLLIVISRNPKDIITMSTGRAWNSCMSLEDAAGIADMSSLRQVINHVTSNTIIAYLIRKNDLNITDPLSRITIKPYRSANKNVVYHVSKVYGIPNAFFRREVKKWVKRNTPKLEQNQIYFPQVYVEHKHDPQQISVKNKVIRHKTKVRIAYYLNGQLHRENEPALIYVDKEGRRCKEYWRHGQFHREDGPAVVFGHNYREWLQNGQFHREDGPAVEMLDGDDTLLEYWINGEEILDEDRQKEINEKA